eukprot:3327221-Lingulodinium_polyedra.AAC.1
MWIAQAARAMSGSSGSKHAPSEYTSGWGRCAPTAAPGSSGPTPCATCAMARNTGSAGQSPERAW